MKACTACHETKPFDSFYFKKTRSVYETRCKDCINESKRKFARDNPDRIRAWSKAGNSKTREHQKEYAKNWRAGNRDRHRAASLRWIKNNPEVHRARMRITVFNRRRAEKAHSDGTVTPEFLKALYARRFCYYCGFPTRRNRRTADHKIPLSRNGLHSAANLVMACFACNASKGSKTDSEFVCEIAC